MKLPDLWFEKSILCRSLNTSDFKCSLGQTKFHPKTTLKKQITWLNFPRSHQTKVCQFGFFALNNNEKISATQISFSGWKISKFLI